MVVPLWLGLLLVLVVAAAIAVLRARRDGTPFGLGRVPESDGSDDPARADGATEEPPGNG